MRVLIILVAFLLSASAVLAQQLPVYSPLKEDMAPLKLAQFVADQIIRQTTFSYQYVVQAPYPDAEIVDLGQSFGKSQGAGVAYALSTLFSEKDQSETFEVGSAAKIKIWINDELVFCRQKDAEFRIAFDERTYRLPEKFVAKLKKGGNKILVKSAYAGEGDWLFILQSRNMGRYAEKGCKIEASLQEYAPGITIANWLVLGCFENPGDRGIDMAFEPEQQVGLFRIYRSAGKSFTWDIPRIHINVENPQGGKFYSWNYHVGGFMWGLQCLSRELNNGTYAAFANRWCDYIIGMIPIVEYQTKKLLAVRSMNWSLVERPMLDYTTAPSLPFLTRLVYEETFPLRSEYVNLAEKTLDYALHKQYRLENGVFARRYTGSPSVWADDMFMGIPFLLFSAQYTNDPELRKSLYDDASNQIIQFSKLLYNKEKKLYMQACSMDKPDEKIPFWSRGNGWAVWGTSEVLKHLPENHKQYKTILQLYRSHIEGIVQMQDENGCWHNLLDDHGTVKESSGAAMFVLAIARGINNGWLNRNDYSMVLEKGWTALKSFIDEDGNLMGVKGGTNFSPDPEDYAKTPFVKSDTHGILPLLFACIEMGKYYKK